MTLEVRFFPPNLTVDAEAPELSVKTGTPVLPGSAPESYGGPYTVTPTKTTQILRTDGLAMDDDVTVNPIPAAYADVTPTTAGAADVAAGKVFVTAGGVPTTGTAEPASLITKVITANDTYSAAEDEADGYSQVTVSVPQGLIIPTGFAYYNGYLLPLIPYADGYNYAWIRRNEQTGNWDLVLGTSQWRSRSNASLDSWALEFANQAVDGSRQYSIPISGDTTTATDWGEYTTSVNYYGTTNNRKVIWSSHDIMINTTGNVLYKHGIALQEAST